MNQQPLVGWQQTAYIPSQTATVMATPPIREFKRSLIDQRPTSKLQRIEVPEAVTLRESADNTLDKREEQHM